MATPRPAPSACRKRREVLGSVSCLAVAPISRKSSPGRKQARMQLPAVETAQRPSDVRGAGGVPVSVLFCFESMPDQCTRRLDMLYMRMRIRNVAHGRTAGPRRACECICRSALVLVLVLVLSSAVYMAGGGAVRRGKGKGLFTRGTREHGDDLHGGQHHGHGQRDGADDDGQHKEGARRDGGLERDLACHTHEVCTAQPPQLSFEWPLGNRDNQKGNHRDNHKD